MAVSVYQNNRPSVLVVAPDFPYPPDHGGRADVWQRIAVLKQLGFSVSLIATVSQAPSEEHCAVVKAVVDDLHLVVRAGARSMFGTTPHQVRSRHRLESYRLSQPFDYTIVEGTSCGGILNNPFLRAGRKLLRVHNNEPRYFRELAASVGASPRALYYLGESLRLRVYDGWLFKQVDGLMFISKSEQLEYLRKRDARLAVFLPPSVDSAAMKPPVAARIASRRVTFVGSLFMPNNRDGIAWYMKHVHPILRAIDGYRFVVAGNSRGQSLNWFRSLPHSDDVEFHDTPLTLDRIYENAAVFVNPMRHGAGLKMKSIEAISKGIPLVATSTGNEGTSLEDGLHVLVRDKPQDFAAAVAESFTDERASLERVISAQSFLREHFDTKVILRKFLATVETREH